MNSLLTLSRAFDWVRSSNRFLLFVVVVISLPFSLDVAFFPGHLDGAIFLYIGEMWSHGTIPYLQLFDNKPPGIFAIIALAAKTHHTLYVLAVFELIFVLACVWTVRRILQRCGAPRGAVYFATIATALMVNLGAFVPGNNPETYMLWPMTASMLAFVHGIEQRRIRYIFLAGILSGVACMFKPFGLSVLIAQILFTLLFSDEPTWRSVLTSNTANVTGAFVAWIPALVYFWLHGGLRELLDASFFYNMHYGAASQRSIVEILSLLAERLLPVSTFVVCLVIGWLGLRKGVPNGPSRRGSLGTLTFFWFVAGLLLVLAAGRGYGHYFMSLTPALGVAAGLFFWWMVEQEASSRLRRMVGALLIAPVFMAYVPWSINTAKDLESVVLHRRQLLPVDGVAWELQQLAPPSSTLMVWGFEPSLFYSTHLRNIIRYPTTQYIYDSPRSYVDVGAEILHGMESTPPDFVVIAPWNFSMSWPHQSDPVHDGFMSIVQQSYGKVWEGQSFSIYRRRSTYLDRSSAIQTGSPQ